MKQEMTRTLQHPPAADLELTQVLHALHATPCASRSCATSPSAERVSLRRFDLPVTKSTGTHHFRVLRDSGVIEQIADGTARVNRLRRADLDARFPGLLDSVLRPAA